MEQNVEEGADDGTPPSVPPLGLTLLVLPVLGLEWVSQPP